MSEIRLPSSLNMALGYFPVIIAILLSQWMHFPEWGATLIGAAIGIVYAIIAFRLGKLPNLLLYGNVVIMLLVGIIMMFVPDSRYIYTYYLVGLEILLLLQPTHMLFKMSSIDINFHAVMRLPQSQARLRSRVMQSTIANVVTSRIVMLCAAVQLLVIVVFLLFAYPLNDHQVYWLFRFSPLAVFALAVLFNQMALGSFNALLGDHATIAIVNDHGDVIGKTSSLSLMDGKTEFRVPMLRVAFVYDHKLYLRQHTLRGEKTEDLLLTDFLVYGKNLSDGVQHMLKRASLGRLKAEFVCQGLYEDYQCKQLNYLFIVRLSEDLFEGFSDKVKLWSTQQIEMNLGKNYFSPAFEQEYETLKKEMLK